MKPFQNGYDIKAISTGKIYSNCLFVGYFEMFSVYIGDSVYQDFVFILNLEIFLWLFFLRDLYTLNIFLT